MAHWQSHLLIALVVTGAPAAAETFTSNCFNTPSGAVSVPITKMGTNAAGLSQASSAKVQYNINQEAGKGVVFVNKRSDGKPGNDGICNFTVSAGYRMLRGVGKIDPVDISSGTVASSAGTPPSITLATKLSCQKQEVDTLVCSVHPIRDDLMGTINVNWIIDYEAAN